MRVGAGFEVEANGVARRKVAKWWASHGGELVSTARACVRRRGSMSSTGAKRRGGLSVVRRGESAAQRLGLRSPMRQG